jgi:hypothetical protein
MALLTRIRRLIRAEDAGAAPKSAAEAAAEESRLAVTPGASERRARDGASASNRADCGPVDLERIIRVEEVANAEFYIGDLFRRRFRSDPPDYPRHFIGVYRGESRTLLPVGYVHYSPFDDAWLCGGLVIDERAYRTLPKGHRNAIRDAGGLAELMLRETFARLRQAPAIWGYVGDKQSEVVCLRAGFRHTSARHVMVVWNADLSKQEEELRLARVVAIGPF